MADTMSLNDVNSMYFDVLKEIGNIGAGNATTALAQMLGTKVDMSVPQVSLLEFKDVGEIVGGEELIMVGILLGVEGDITGSIMFMIEKEGARHLTNKLMMGMGASQPGEDFNEMELSALREVGNIITGAYLNALSGLTNLCIYPSTPDLTVDMAGAILSVPAIQFGIQGDQILLIKNNFFDEVELDGFFILLPDVESYGTILKALGISSL
ncbi:MAG: chemotaxis protein CheC [Lachnospiraceae bacterium]|nr:chemotaxis protein CheC [Lachnospiraceae bacterium]